jgi:hypothetical protein
MGDELTMGQRVDRLSRRRRRIVWSSALIFMLWQGSFATWGLGDQAPVRAVDQVKLAAWAVWALVLLIMLATGGGFLRDRETRRRMNDELSTANRHTGQRVGFWIGAVTLVGLYVASLFIQVSAHDLLHLTLTLMVGGALLTYAALERRAERES